MKIKPESHWPDGNLPYHCQLINNWEKFLQKLQPQAADIKCAPLAKNVCAFIPRRPPNLGTPFPSSLRSSLPIPISLALSRRIFGPYVEGGGILAAAQSPGDGESTLGARRSQDV